MSENKPSTEHNSVIFLRIPKLSGDKCVRWLKTHQQIDETYQILQYNEILLIPVISKTLTLPMEIQSTPLDIFQYPSESVENEFKTFIDAHLQRINFFDKHVPSLSQALQGKMPLDCLSVLPHSFDVIGSIAILEINREEQQILRPYITLIGQTMLATNKNLTAVFEKAGDVNGVFRTRPLQHIAGEPSTVTLHKENACTFEVDIATTFFTPRLVFERKRVAELDSPYITQGVTWDMFCGVGPFLIQVAKQHPEGEYIGTDINPEAITFALKNAKRNKLKGHYTFHVQDLMLFLPKTPVNPLQNDLKDRVSRIVMNLPEKNLEFIPLLPPFLHPKGALLHIYQFNPNADPFNDAETQLINALTNVNLQCKEILGHRIVKPFSPARDTTVLDVIIARS